jgi:hypothetical protein
MGAIKGVRYCQVVSVSDDTDSDLIKVKILPEDSAYGEDYSKLPYAFPLLPKMLHVKPKVGEGVFVFLTEEDNSMSQRYYIGPVISQDHRIFKDNYLYATSFMRGTPFKPDIAPRTKSEMNGILPNDDDIVIRGRKNADIQITNDDVRIKSGVKVVNDGDEYDMWFNTQDPAYVKVKYHPDGLRKKEVESVSYGGNKKFNVEFKEQKEQVKSTVTVVADKINLLQNHSKEVEFKTTDNTDLITDDELKRALDEAYKLPYGEKLVEILSLFIDAFIKHTHPFSMLPPCNANGIPDLKDKKTEYLDNGKMLSDAIRIN